MAFDPVAQLARDAAAAGVSIDDILADAKVAKTTWQRWAKKEFAPRMATLHKLSDALERRRRKAKRAKPQPQGEGKAA